MPTNQFYDLNDVKKQHIISVGISEFANYGFTDSSTNRIVKACGISKGSLFQYFAGKEDLYFYLLDYVTGELNTSLNEKIESLSGDLCERVIQYAQLEFSWYMQNADSYKLIMKAFRKNDTEIYRKTAARFYGAGQDIYYHILKDTDTKYLKWDLQKIMNVLKWFLQGFNEEFISSAEAQNGDSARLEGMRNEYVKTLTEYLEILKKGFLHTKEADHV